MFDNLENRDNIMSSSLGHELVRAKPLTLTFYDWLKEYPYTSTFYIREETADEDCHRFIHAVEVMSSCVLGKYKLGYRQFVVPDYRDRLKDISPHVLGTFKWRISYLISNGLTRSHTIPGYKISHSMAAVNNSIKGGKNKANIEHEDWKNFVAVFHEVCVSSEGESIPSWVDIEASKSNWPPPAWKKKHH